MQKQCLNDNCYNVIKQLTKKQQFLAHVNRYIQDAKKNGDSEAEKTWRTIQTDEQKHADLLHDLIASEVKNNRFWLEKDYSKIDEARVTIKRQRKGGKKQSCEVSILIITPHKRHCYREIGWDLSNVCETLGQRLLSNLTKRHTKRLKKSIRKIEEKLF